MELLIRVHLYTKSSTQVSSLPFQEGLMQMEKA